MPYADIALIKGIESIRKAIFTVNRNFNLDGDGSRLVIVEADERVVGEINPNDVVTSAYL